MVKDVSACSVGSVIAGSVSSVRSISSGGKEFSLGFTCVEVVVVLSLALFADSSGLGLEETLDLGGGTFIGFGLVLMAAFTLEVLKKGFCLIFILLLFPETGN